MSLIQKIAEQGANELNDTVKDKTATVFGRAYLFSWVVYNYKPLIVIFSLENFYTKLLWLPDFMPSGFSGFARSLGVPFICASLYVLASPSSEIIMRAGSRLSDYGMRRLNALLDRNEWHSEEEVAGFRRDFEDELGKKIEIIKQQNDAITDAKRINAENLDRYRLLLDIYIKLRSSDEFEGSKLGWDEGAHQLIIAKVQQPLSPKLASIRQLPEYCVANFVGAVSDQSNEIRLPWVNAPSADQYLASVYWFVTLGLAEVTIDEHYEMTLAPTDAGVVLIDQIVAKYPEKKFSGVWREYRARRGW